MKEGTLLENTFTTPSLLMRASHRFSSTCRDCMDRANGQGQFSSSLTHLDRESEDVGSLESS